MSARSVRRRAVVLAGLPLAACSIFDGHVEVSKRYAHLDTTPIPAAATITCTDPTFDASCIDARLSAVPAPADPPLAITALSDRGQAAYVRGLAEATQGADALTAAVAAPVKPGAPPANYVDATTFRLRFALSLLPHAGYLAPGDRIDWAQVEIEPRSPDGTTARFTGWSMAANAHETIDVGTISAVRNESLGVSGGVTLAPGITGPSVTSQIGTTRTENATITDHTGIFAAVAEGKGWIVQYGAWRRDLVGTSTFDATVQLSPRKTQLLQFTTANDFRVKNPKTGASTWQVPAKLSLSQRGVRVPRREPLCAKVSLDFIVRHVISGAQTTSESDDRITLRRGRIVSTQYVTPPAITSVWRLGSRGQLLQFQGSDGSESVLAFPDRDSAVKFAAWLRGAAVTGPVGDGTLFFDQPGTRLDPALVAGLDAFNPDALPDWTAAQQTCPAPAKAK